MSKRIQFEGATHEFPDDFTDSDIAKALNTAHPKVIPGTEKTGLPGVPLAVNENTPSPYRELHTKINTPSDNRGPLESAWDQIKGLNPIPAIQERFHALSTPHVGMTSVPDDFSQSPPPFIGPLGDAAVQASHGNVGGAAGTLAGATVPTALAALGTKTGRATIGGGIKGGLSGLTDVPAIHLTPSGLRLDPLAAVGAAVGEHLGAPAGVPGRIIGGYAGAALPNVVRKAYRGAKQGFADSLTALPEPLQEGEWNWPAHDQPTPKSASPAPSVAQEPASGGSPAARSVSPYPIPDEERVVGNGSAPKESHMKGARTVWARAMARRLYHNGEGINPADAAHLTPEQLDLVASDVGVTAASKRSPESIQAMHDELANLWKAKGPNGSNGAKQTGLPLPLLPPLPPGPQ